MKNVFLLFCIILIACNSASTGSNKSKKTDSEPKNFFNYDEIVHYRSDVGEDKISKLFDNQSKSEIDSIKTGVILGEIPKSINDTLFISKLDVIGYKKENIDKSEFGKINQILRENPSVNRTTTSCIYIFRDILIFKRKSKTIGIVKICFACLANQVVGTTANTENFGTIEDYDKLHDILRK